MEPVTISLNESLKAFVDTQVAEGYGTSDAYFAALVEGDLKRKARDKIETLLLEGLESPKSEMTRADWDELKRQVWEREKKKVADEADRKKSVR